jgi:hypothetical protein
MDKSRAVNYLVGMRSLTAPQVEERTWRPLRTRIWFAIASMYGGNPLRPGWTASLRSVVSRRFS